MPPNRAFEILPYSVKPINYNIEFIPNTDTFKFKGIQTVDVNIEEEVSIIKLNSLNLIIHEAYCNKVQANVTYDVDNELVLLTFPKSLDIGTAKLSITYQGDLSDGLKGFYRSVHKSPDGEVKNILCTQFESVWARRAFPCWDEPDRKASFEISLVVLDNLVGLSNMPEISRTPIIPPPADLPAPSGGHFYVRLKFAPTPLMSTYLVAMVIGEFDYLAGKSANGVDIRVFTSPGKSDCGQLALDVAERTLLYYEEYFGIKFPLPKLDLVAIPDFAAGAMENWGLVTYREVSLLVHPVNSSLSTRQNVALVVGHELAHMWFGNLVTMSWWTHLWLNEGFATWIEYLSIDHCFPTFDIWTQFVNNELSTALELDSLRTSHPIEVDVCSPNEIDEIFDTISYAKGAVIIRMLERWIGKETFTKGLQTYLAKFQYSNASTADLWSVLGQTSGYPVEETMSTWTRQTGYPVLFVKPAPHQAPPDGEKTTEDRQVRHQLSITQTRFFADGSSEENEATQWIVPLTICNADDDDNILASQLLRPTDPPGQATFVTLEPAKVGSGTSVSTDHKDSLEFPAIRLNPGTYGLYRVHYSPALLPGVMTALANQTVPAKSRLAFIDDQFALARAGHLTISVVLDVLRAFTGEPNYVVWSSIVNGLSLIRVLLQETTYTTSGFESLDTSDLETVRNAVNHISPAERGLRTLIRQISEPVFDKLGWVPAEKESHNDSLLRPLIISVLGRCGHESIIQEARDRFASHFSELETAKTNGCPPDSTKLIPPDLRSAVYAIVLRNGTGENFERMLKLHTLADMQDEKVRIINCLGCIPDAEVLRDRLFQFATSSNVRKQDRHAALLSCTGTAFGRRQLWGFLRANLDELTSDLSSYLLGYVIKGAVGSLCSEDRLQECKLFFADNNVPCVRAVQQAIETIGVNIGQAKRNGDTYIKFLEELNV